MEILFGGNLRPLSNRFFDKIGDENKCVAAGESSFQFNKKNTISYQDFRDDEGMRKIFGTFNFDATVFFSKSLDGAVRIFDELENLENILYLCKQYKVKQFVYLISNDMQSCSEADKKSSRYILMQACEKLCRSFAEDEGVHVMILRLPYLYSMEETDNQLHNWIKEALKEDQITIQGTPGAETDFLCEDDLGELVLRILDEPDSKGLCQMNLSGGNRLLFSEVTGHIKAATGKEEVNYGNYTLCIPQCNGDTMARKEYGWYPVHILKDDIDKIERNMVKAHKQKKRLYERRESYKKLRNKIRIVTELIIVFALAMGLNYLVKDNVLLNFLDFRMLFVVMMGMMNGLNTGVAAAILASLGYVISNAGAMQWQIIFYNVQNWLPFACYFLLGAVSGYTRDKHDDEVLFVKEEEDILEQKYIFLNELYLRVLENKDSFNSQIIGYKDSFGKLYSVVKKLDTTLEDRVLFEAVNVLEEMLDSHSVAIYTMNGYSDFARLNVCSKSMNSELSKSLKLSSYPELLSCMKENTLFVNTLCLKDYPVYATPVYKDEELLGMILLKYANDSQMNMEFSNKFTIITDLIKGSMVRAMEYAQYSSQFIDGTQILKMDKFREILDIKHHMKEKEYLDYTLLKLEQGVRSLEELSNQVSGMVRNNDVLGLLDDEKVYLLLSQTGAQGMEIIRERMEKANVAFEVVQG